MADQPVWRFDLPDWLVPEEDEAEDEEEHTGGVGQGQQVAAVIGDESLRRGDLAPTGACVRACV